MVVGGEISDGATKPQAQGTPRSPLRKRVLPIPASSEDPGLSACHRCNLKTFALQLLPSEWRVLLLCRECLSALFSGQICSYCFKELSVEADLYLNCLLCFSRVHYDCVPNHRLVICQWQIDDFNKFTFFDCRLFPESDREAAAAADGGADASSEVGDSVDSD